MSQTGYRTFDATIEKTNHVLNEIEESYGWSKEQRHQSYDALRAVLHTLRDRLPVGEAADLAAQLPMLIRGLYYQGWVPARVPVKMNREEFLLRVGQECPFEVEGGLPLLVNRVMQALRSFITDGEWGDIVHTLPKDVASMLAA